MTEYNTFLKNQEEFHSSIIPQGFGVHPEELAENRERLLGHTWLRNHDNNPEYGQVLYGDITRDRQAWTGRTALDFGSGWGGNMENLLKLAKGKIVEGYDVDKKAVDYAQRYLKARGHAEKHYIVHHTRGDCLNNTKDGTVDFVTSIVVLQHIAHYAVRYAILKEFFRVLAPGGFLSFQMNKGGGTGRGYYTEQRGVGNCIVGDPAYVLTDLKKIGFTDVSFSPGYNPGSRRKNGGLYFKGKKL